jgi:hypothetical protein
MFSNRIFAATLIAVVTTGEAVAAPSPNVSNERKDSSLQSRAPLPAGRSTTIREAQGIGRPLLYWGAAGATIITAVILMSEDGEDAPATTVTTGTSN